MANIVVCVSSSIAIYKVLDLISHLKKNGHTVFPVLSRSAEKMVSPLLFQNLSGQKVHNDMYDTTNPNSMEHIRLAKLADLVVYTPATANIVSKLAHGMADDLMSTLALCVTCPKIVFPAMNPAMWLSQITQENIDRCKRLDMVVIEPEAGVVACGDEGIGKLASVNKMTEVIAACLQRTPSKLRGKKVLVTAGGTSEPIDPVRIISNRSSGKMSFALAKHLIDRGAELTYLYGNIETGLPVKGRHVRFGSTSDLQEKLLAELVESDVLIMAAAPSDYRIKNYSEAKIKKSGGLTLEMIENQDILANLKKKKGQAFVGFAAETENIKEYAKKKLAKKNLDLIVGNKVSGQAENFGIGGDLTEITLLDEKEVLVESGVISKDEAAKVILDEIEKKL